MRYSCELSIFFSNGILTYIFSLQTLMISICRLAITVLGCVIKMLLLPFKYISGGGRSGAGSCKTCIFVSTNASYYF